MNDTMDERLLVERLHRLADGVDLPTTRLEEDVRRPRTRLWHRHGLRLAVAGLTAVAVAGVGASAIGAGSEGRGTDQSIGAVAEQPAAEVPGRVAPDSSRAVELESLFGSLAQGVVGGRFTLAELEAMAEVVQQRLSGRFGWIGVGLASSWQSAGADDCLSGWTCVDVTVRGATRARWATSATARQLVADLPSGVVVLTVGTGDQRPSNLAYGTD